MPNIRVKRIYEPKAADDGSRVLVDRIWPRGLTRDAAAIDHWFKELAPSTKLRTWFGHRPERWPEFARRYRAELKDAAAQPLLGELAAMAAAGPLTLLYSARDQEHNQALVLAQVLRAKLARSKH
jgi:uncharacterized protein YeaO (DUF488 family)